MLARPGQTATAGLTVCFAGKSKQQKQMTQTQCYFALRRKGFYSFKTLHQFILQVCFLPSPLACVYSLQLAPSRIPILEISLQRHNCKELYTSLGWPFAVHAFPRFREGWYQVPSGRSA